MALIRAGRASLDKPGHVDRYTVQHHTCTHEGGFGVSGDANGTLTFVRPDGTILGRSAALAPDGQVPVTLSG